MTMGTFSQVEKPDSEIFGAIVDVWARGCRATNTAFASAQCVDPCTLPCALEQGRLAYATSLVWYGIAGSCQK